MTHHQNDVEKFKNGARKNVERRLLVRAKTSIVGIGKHWGRTRGIKEVPFLTDVQIH